MNEVQQKIEEIETRVRSATRIHQDDYHETMHRLCAESVKNDGLWLEFGVYRGRSLTQFAGHTDKIVYGFDSFEGLPEHWNNENPLGVYSLAGQTPIGPIDGPNDGNPGMYSTEPTKNVRPWPMNVELVKGWFSDTLPGFLEENKELAAFVHIDSDVYSSCQDVLGLLEKHNRFQEGTIILFDELMDYPEYKDHEIKAFAEFLLETGWDFDVVYYQNISQYSQVCVRLK